MARFFGAVGYGENLEIRPGVYQDDVVEKEYYGVVLKNSRSLSGGDKVNSDISVGNSISIMADAYAYANYFNMNYVVWNGVRWVVSEVTVERPRLTLRLGGVYNGPTPTASTGT